MAWEAAWMWGFQASLGSLGKQSCAPSWALLGSLNRSPSPAAGTRWRRTILLQQRLQCHCISINTQIISATYTYSSLLVSHFYTKFRDTCFLLSFLFPTPLSHGSMKPQKAKQNTAPCCKHPPKWGNLLTAFEAFTSLTQHRSAQTRQGRARLQEPRQPKCHNPKPHRLRQTWDFTATRYLCKQPTLILLPPKHQVPSQGSGETHPEFVSKIDGSALKANHGKTKFSSRSKPASCGEVKTQPLRQVRSHS